MQKKAYIITILLFAGGLIRAQNFTAVPFSSFEKFLDTKNDTLYVVNFWATWCKPCIEEMPYFEQINNEKGTDKLRVILVSVDTETRWKSSLEPFISNKNVISEVWSFYNDKPVDWIDRISPQWNGSIPATLFLYNGQKTFYEKEFTYDELHNILQQLKS